jgi:glycerate-2-kinase
LIERAIVSELIEEARQIYIDAMAAIDISAVFGKKVKAIDELLIVNSEIINLSEFKEVYLIGIGKASIEMGKEVEALLGPRLTSGILVCDRRHKVDLRSQLIIAGHPVPDTSSLRAGSSLLELVKSSSPESLIIFLISGGGSALVESPVTPELSLEDFRKLNAILVHCGASIREINTIRRRFSRIKGGGLWAEARAARGLALYISDVNVGDISSIASGPLLPDESSDEDFQRILDKYSLLDKVPHSMRHLIMAGRVKSRPGQGKTSAAITHHVLLDSTNVIEAALAAALEKGYVAEAARDIQEGNYAIVGDELLRRLIELQKENPSKPVCLVSGGELSCPVTGGGIGGRNQEFVLYCASRIASFNTESSVVVLSCGTDGIDGNSCAAGAIASSAMLLEAERNGLNYSVYLKANDSHSFFKKVGGLIATGPTGNNVRDIRIMLSEPETRG